MTDSQLLGLLKTSDKSSFDELYRRYFSTLYTFAYKIVQDKEACRDAVQDIFIWLWENRETLDIDHLKNYLVASVKIQTGTDDQDLQKTFGNPFRQSDMGRYRLLRCRAGSKRAPESHRGCIVAAARTRQGSFHIKPPPVSVQ